MLKFDRIVLVMLALGVWALVLAPQVLDAHHQYDDGHSCDIAGKAYGYIDELSEGARITVKKWSRVSVDCTHY